MSRDAELEILRAELEETKAQLDIVEGQRIQLATDYQEAVAKLELVRGVITSLLQALP